MCERVCVYACTCACVRARVCVCVRVCVTQALRMCSALCLLLLLSAGYLAVETALAAVCRSRYASEAAVAADGPLACTAEMAECWSSLVATRAPTPHDPKCGVRGYGLNCTGAAGRRLVDVVRARCAPRPIPATHFASSTTGHVERNNGYFVLVLLQSGWEGPD